MVYGEGSGSLSCIVSLSEGPDIMHQNTQLTIFKSTETLEMCVVCINLS